MNFRSIALVFSVAGVLSAACDSREPSPSPAGSPAGPIQPAAKPIPPKPSTPSPAIEEESADTWLSVNKGGVELGVIELRAGKPPKLSIEKQNEDSAELKAKLDEIGGPDGIPLDMHLPPPSGKGRGPYGTRIIKYGDALYRHAVEGKLEPTYGVREVTRLVDALPPEKFQRVRVSRSGQKVGTLDFSAKPPKLTVDAKQSDAGSMKNDWERIQELGELKVRYHHLKDTTETLVTAHAKPGDSNYPQVVVLYLMVERYYRPRYAYKLDFE